jgi:hypothetical protein
MFGSERTGMFGRDKTGDVPENNPSLILVPGETHNSQGLAHRYEGAEIYEARDETGDQSEDERLTATPTNNQIGFLGAAQRWSQDSDT